MLNPKCQVLRFYVPLICILIILSGSFRYADGNHNGAVLQSVTEFTAKPLSACLVRHSSSGSSVGGHHTHGDGTSCLTFWQNGTVVWHRGGIRGWAWLRYVPQLRSLVWCTFHALHIVRLGRQSKTLVYSAPTRFVFLNYMLTIDHNGGKLISVPLEGVDILAGQPREAFRLEIIDVVNHTVTSVPLVGFPLKTEFYGRSLLVSAASIRPSGPRRFFFDKFAVGKVRNRLVVHRTLHNVCSMMVRSFVNGKPVVIDKKHDQILIGTTAMQLRLRRQKIKQVVDAQDAALVLLSDGSYGVAKAPRWTYHRLGRLSSGKIIGTGRNRTGFWLAQSTGTLGRVRIIEVGKQGVIMAVSVATAPAARK